ncbi:MULTISPECIES: hypothetical protein [Desulfosporosinus]|uniref:KOW domain-containing protein n=1 Tax=Desulfosporosinus acididurans TaxID=476652 RepID=A0A0J1FKG6_9FIRM|nr:MULTISPECIES: hypothetical protein [Desulfosporosinus]KLU63965.1 hypothetical protein DEAC_c40950 [Desulfosporosinus acididurans]
MSKSIFELETNPLLMQDKKFQVGNRVKTNNDHKGTIVRVDRDEMGVFLVVQLDFSTHEFAYDQNELELL